MLMGSCIFVLLMLTGSMCFCAVAEKRLAVVGHYVTSEYLEVCVLLCFRSGRQAGAGRAGGGKA